MALEKIDIDTLDPAATIVLSLITHLTLPTTPYV